MPSQYEIPTFGTPGATIHSWMLEAVAEGDIWLRAQKPSREWDKIIDVLGPQYAGPGVAAVGQSNTGYNKVRKIYTELRATLSNFRHAGEYNPTDDDATELFDRAKLLTQLDENWERTTFPTSQLRDALSYALGMGTGYLYEDWDTAKWGPGRGDIRLRSCDPKDITFVQLPKTHDIQQAYVVLIREELPLQLAKRMYAWNSTFANGLRADREAPGWIQKGLERVQQFMSPALRAGGSIRKANDSFPTVDIWHAYSLDGAINSTGAPMPMGALNTNWAYNVPCLGQSIPQGIINPKTGQQWTLPATPDDCLLFPLRRLTVFARTGMAYDGSSPWWHGDVPVARIRFNDQPWEALGASQVGDATTIQDGIIAMMRSVEDSVAARLDPLTLYDDGRMDKATAESINPRKAGVRVAADLSQGSPIEYPFPPQFYDVPAWIISQGGFIQQQEERMDYVTSARDLVAVAKAQQIPSADTLEKLMEMAGPVVQDMVNAIVEPWTQLGQWRKAYYFQFYTRTRMLRIADPDGNEMLQNVKYLPEKLVPLRSDETVEALKSRSRAYLNDYRYDVTESGITAITRMSQTLLYVQLKKIGMPLSWFTLAKVAKIPNYGPPPKGTNNEQERSLAEQRMEIELKVELAQELQKATGGAPPGDGGAPGQAGPGRPATFEKPPHIVNKPNEGRSTIATS